MPETLNSCEPQALKWPEEVARQLIGWSFCCLQRFQEDAEAGQNSDRSGHAGNLEHSLCETESCLDQTRANKTTLMTSMQCNGSLCSEAYTAIYLTLNSKLKPRQPFSRFTHPEPLAYTPWCPCPFQPCT